MNRPACLCSRFTLRCQTKPTQEDLLCDTCRDGCGGAIGFDTDGMHVVRISVGEWSL